MFYKRFLLDITSFLQIFSLGQDVTFTNLIRGLFNDQGFLDKVFNNKKADLTNKQDYFDIWLNDKEISAFLFREWIIGKPTNKFIGLISFVVGFGFPGYLFGYHVSALYDGWKLISICILLFFSIPFIFAGTSYLLSSIFYLVQKRKFVSKKEVIFSEFFEEKIKKRYITSVFDYLEKKQEPHESDNVSWTYINKIKEYEVKKERNAIHNQLSNKSFPSLKQNRL